MKIHTIFLSLFYLIFSPCSIAASNQAVPSGMTYQGRLTDASSAPVPDGSSYEIEVRLWSANTGGTLLWGSRYTGVPLKSGAFNLILGSGGTPIAGATTTDLKAVFSTATVYLGLTTTKSASGAAISSPTEILPRQQIFSTPYAYQAEQSAAVQPDGVLSSAIKDGEVKTADLADAAITTQKIAASSINSSHIQDGSIKGSDIADEAIKGINLSHEFAIFVDEQAPGISGGSSIAGWQTRTLNTTSASSGISITRVDNLITLQAGTYYIHALAPSYGAGHHQAVFRRVSDDVTVIKGESATSQSTSANSISDIEGYYTVKNEAETFDVYHYTQTARPSIGLGYALPFTAGVLRTESSVFTKVHIVKIK
jgi:hypothetical protein